MFSRQGVQVWNVPLVIIIIVIMMVRHAAFLVLGESFNDLSLIGILFLMIYLIPLCFQIKILRFEIEIFTINEFR